MIDPVLSLEGTQDEWDELIDCVNSARKGSATVRVPVHALEMCMNDYMRMWQSLEDVGRRLMLKENSNE